MASTTDDPRQAAAEDLHRLAIDYAARAHASAAAMVRSFQADAASLLAEIGGLLIEDADDEQLSLTPRGRFEGRVQTDEGGDWQSVSSPDDVAEHYDPVDLFNDVASAIEDEFPGLLGEDESEQESDGEITAAEESADDQAESASVQSLKRLHAAGVLSDAQFEAKKAELNR